jgi:hypothetical protein
MNALCVIVYFRSMIELQEIPPQDIILHLRSLIWTALRCWGASDHKSKNFSSTRVKEKDDFSVERIQI